MLTQHVHYAIIQEGQPVAPQIEGNQANAQSSPLYMVLLDPSKKLQLILEGHRHFNFSCDECGR